MSKTLDLLKKVTSIPGAGSYIENIETELINLLSKYGKATVDSLGNISCTFGEGKHFLLDAHYDEIGLIVTSITDEGFVKFASLGGIDVKILQDKEVVIHGGKDVEGIISMIPVHLKKDDDKLTEIADLAIDTGLTVEEVKCFINLGDVITFKRRFSTLLGNSVSSNCLDNRAGVVAILNAIDVLAQENVKITVLFSNQEELGTRGAKCFKVEDDIEECLIVDTSFAMDSYCNKYDCGEMSEGAMIGLSPILDKHISKAMVKTAKDNNIPYQFEVMFESTGTNADVLTLADGGIKCSLVSIPIRYMHTPFETVDVSDIDAVSNLITTYILGRVN